MYWSEDRCNAAKVIKKNTHSQDVDYWQAKVEVIGSKTQYNIEPTK